MNVVKCGIYKITNLVNGKAYMGQSQDIYRRWKQHRNGYNNPKSTQYESPLYRAMRKYGINNFNFEILCLCSLEQLDDKEIEYISQYSSYKEENGYNLTLGGDLCFKGLKLTKEQANEIIILLRDSTLSQIQIAEQYHVTQQMISDINSGHSWFQENINYPIRQRNAITLKKRGLQYVKCPICGKEILSSKKYCSAKCAHMSQRKVKNRPTKEQLELLVKDNSFEGLGRQFGVTGNAVKKWCETYGIDYRKIRK